MATIARTIAPAPPMNPDVWWQRLVMLMSATLLSAVWGTIVIWACIEYGDWRSTSDGGDQKLLCEAVVISVAIPVASTTKLIKSLPQIGTAKTRAPGRWVVAVPYVEQRRHRTWLGDTHHDHWWLALHAVGSKQDSVPDLTVKVSERCATCCVGHPTVALYGERHGRDRWAVLAIGDAIVWPFAQDWVLPENGSSTWSPMTGAGSAGALRSG